MPNVSFSEYVHVAEIALVAKLRGKQPRIWQKQCHAPDTQHRAQFVA
jgi:hypothetical protein